MATDTKNKKPVRVSAEAHDKLKAYCDRTGRTQVEVVSELLNRIVKPRLDALRGTQG